MADLIGVFGGTFDPPHLAHLILAEEARSQLGLSRVLWVVSGVPPHKPGWPISDLVHRLAMVELAIDDNPSFRISRVDIDRPPPHYSHETLGFLASEFPASKLVFLMGSDSLRDLNKWGDPAAFIARADKIAVYRRPGVELEIEAIYRDFPSLRRKLELLDIPLVEISGVVIRDRVRANRSYRYFSTPAVCAYIEKNRLYR